MNCNWGKNCKKWAQNLKKMIFESKLGQKNTFLKLKSGQKIKKKKKCPKTEFLSQIWAKMAKNGPKKILLKPKLGQKWQNICKN